MTDIFPMRVLPELGPDNTGFWTSGKDGVLRIEQCNQCSTWIQPAKGFCYSCHSEDVTLTPVSGKGTIQSFTVNHQPWFGDIPPYVVVLVDLDVGTEEAPVRLTSNLIGSDIETIEIGAQVEVFFIECEDVWLHQFKEVK